MRFEYNLYLLIRFYDAFRRFDFDNFFDFSFNLIESDYTLKQTE